MGRCVKKGCQRLVPDGFDMCEQHYVGEPSPCCGAQIMAATEGQKDLAAMTIDELFGVCSACGQIIYAGEDRLPVEVLVVGREGSD